MKDEVILNMTKKYPTQTDLNKWVPVKCPDTIILKGNYCELERLSSKIHAENLYNEFNTNADNSIWEYLPYGPFSTYSEFAKFIEEKSLTIDPFFYAITDINTNKPLGFCSFLRIDSLNGVIEIGHLAFGPNLQKTTLATEAICLLIKYALKLGYRRIEWKCNTRNLQSKKSAERFGFKFEGEFRQAAVVKGKNRDTAWYSIIDIEANEIIEAFDKWLSTDNFDSNGRQIHKLEMIRSKLAEQ